MSADAPLPGAKAKAAAAAGAPITSAIPTVSSSILCCRRNSVADAYICVPILLNLSWRACGCRHRRRKQKHQPRRPPRRNHRLRRREDHPAAGERKHLPHRPRDEAIIIVRGGAAAPQQRLLPSRPGRLHHQLEASSKTRRVLTSAVSLSFTFVL
jgi:hypothetical protein